ncbi:unnamed protein product [Dracunculus medinensis]|uniref:phosphoinositide phospholipase C n=1 Tax=Dracunculus medinensis TaxID=318479 RepID=A0A0N4U0F3_DRAME|nr:unnamed protein product [Dracunculus medinensis]
MLSHVCDKRPSTYVEITFYGHFSDLSTFSKRKYRTKTVPENGIDPIIFPGMASIRLAVFEESGRLIGHRFLQVRSIQSGYRHVSLRNAFNRPIGPATLFVRFRVHDYVDQKNQYLVEALQNPIAAMKKEQAASAALVNPIETLKMRENMLHALEESEPKVFTIEMFQNEGSDEIYQTLENSLSFDKAERLKTRFYIDDMELKYASLEEFEANAKIVKLEKSFRKKFANVIETVELALQRVPSASPHKISDSAFTAYAKFEKERCEQIIALVENNKKKLLKRIDMAHKCESKQLMKLIHQKRFDDQMKSNGRAEAIEELREKYVKLGIEEQRRLNKAKERRVKEIEEKFEVMRKEMGLRTDDVCPLVFLG